MAAQFDASTAMECAFRCKSFEEPKCLAYQFNRQKKSCEISYESAVAIEDEANSNIQVYTGLNLSDIIKTDIN